MADNGSLLLTFLSLTQYQVDWLVIVEFILSVSITLILTHWGRVTLSILGSDNGLSPGRRQAIIRTNAGLLLIGTLGTNFSEIIGEIHTFSFKEMHLKMSSAKWRPFSLGLNVLNPQMTFPYTYRVRICSWITIPVDILASNGVDHTVKKFLV